MDPSGHKFVEENNDDHCTPEVIGGCQVVANEGFLEGAILSPDVLEPAQEAMEELRVATDPSMIHIVWDDEGNIDPAATLTASTKILPALHACALAVGGACSISVGEAGYGGGLGERGSFDIWVSSDKQMAVTATLGGGAYASPQLGGGGFSASVNVLPGANINDVGEWFVQTGGSIVYVEGVGGEMFFVKTDHGVLSGLSGSWSSGQSLEWHASATYSWYFLDPVDLP